LHNLLNADFFLPDHETQAETLENMRLDAARPPAVAQILIRNCAGSQAGVMVLPRRQIF
jgi:hypothetical protein